jgi:hypothetical protein
MADREWFLTKVTGTVMGLLLVMSMGIGAANLHFDLKRDVEMNREDIIANEESESKKWEIVWEDVSVNEDHITDLRLSQGQLETKFLEIIRRLDELKSEMEKWEPNPRG